MFVSGSQDKTARIWDLRVGSSVGIIPSQSPGKQKRLVQPGIEPGTSRVWGERDNHYTTEPFDIDMSKILIFKSLIFCNDSTS